MPVKKGSKFSKYSTIKFGEGVNYRDIADTMTELGYPMNHSSARNYIIRVMKKFVLEFAKRWDVDIGESKAHLIAKSMEFQQNVSDLLDEIEHHRRWTIKNKKHKGS